MIMSTGISVKDAMVSRVVTIRPGQNIKEAAEMMTKEEVGLLVVVEGAKPVGVITREDIIKRIVAMDLTPSEKTVKENMESPMIAAEPDEDLADAARRMVQHGFERLPVVSMGKLVGLISDRGIAKVAPAAIEILRERLTIASEPEIVEELNEGECQTCGNYSSILHNVDDKWLCSECKDDDSS
ncbi:MAG: CBS domain-containing protein [Candidatus Aenigmarchaeota archaeon]|nr:CBS domain-containing protein [Candidatus Aenigmarchaeota archaeon]